MTFVETIRIENGIIRNLDLHSERLWRTASFHYGTKPDIHIDLSKMPSELQGVRVKCRVLYSSEILSIEFHPYNMRNIGSLLIVEDPDVAYDFKSTDRAALNGLFEKRGPADDIIITKNGNITDTSFSNLVFETSDGKLYTPETYLLAGTQRAYLLKNGVIRERKITVDDLPLYEKVYLINAMIGLEDNVSVPVSRIGIL